MQIYKYFVSRWFNRRRKRDGAGVWKMFSESVQYRSQILKI